MSHTEYPATSTPTEVATVSQDPTSTPITWETPTVTPTQDPRNAPIMVEQTPNPCCDCDPGCSPITEQVPVFDDPEPLPNTGEGPASFDDDYGLNDAMGDLFGWIGHWLADGLDWLFTEASFSNFFVAYLAVVSLIYMIKYLNRSKDLQEARKDQEILAHIKANDPDLVDEARIEVAFPHLKGRVTVDDWDEDGNSLHDPERGMRPDYV